MSCLYVEALIEEEQPFHLGIFRSDYLLHAPQGSSEPISLKQVEFNTISSSFGALSERASGLHKSVPIIAKPMQTLTYSEATYSLQRTILA